MAFPGIIIGFLAIAIAVGVGLIVHLAENRSFECVFPDHNSNESPGAVGTSGFHEEKENKGRSSTLVHLNDTYNFYLT